MTITTTQKIIKIGTSRGVTIPAKEFEELRLAVGQKVKVTIEAIEEPTNIRTEYEAFRRQYGDTLKNLADR